MSLKQSIVCVNEFSIKKPDGSGSRGATPGSYVERYMAREQAVESLAPIQRLRTDDFILRYMAREDAVEQAVAEPVPTIGRRRAKEEMRQAVGDGGVAFGYGTASLSDEQLRAASRDIQRHFDAGHTVLKTVLSFDEQYLRRHGIVPEDFVLSGRGGYRGHIDQMKLRMAIMHGMDRMATAGFDDLRWVGVIQVDTEHVHAHIAAVDAGRGQITRDGTQRGKLLEVHKSRLRRGVDSFLDQKQRVAHLSSAVGYERRNVTSFIKRWAHERIRTEALPQFLVATLPEDRTLWRAGSNDERMRKPNRIVTELVEEQLARPGSPLPAAMEKVTDYADDRREREGLSTEQWQRLVDQGRARITERAVNGVYQMLRALPEHELRVRTPMLEVMGMDYEQMALMAADRGEDGREDDVVSFGFRLRSYSTRLEHHRRKAADYRDLARQWERAEKAEVVAEDSRPLYDFYRYERDWHSMLMAKYQHFLPFSAEPSAWQDRQREAFEYGQRLLSLTAMRHDASLQRMKDPEEAERLGREVYEQPGGRHLTQGASGRAVLDDRISKMRRNYDERVAELREDLAAEGLLLRAEPSEDSEQQDAAGSDAAGDGGSDDQQQVPPGSVLSAVPGARYDFEEVKALDLHHLGYDFASDVRVGHQGASAFVKAAAERRRLLLGAMDYLDASGQSQAIADLPVDDVARMRRVAADLSDQLREQAPGAEEPVVLRSRIAELRAESASAEADRRSATASLDAGLVVRVRSRVDEAVLEPGQAPGQELEDRQPGQS